MTEEKRGRGRPATGKTPQRQLGRVDDETWEMLQSAAKNADQSFTEWAVGELTRAARRQAKRRRQQSGE